MELMQEVKDYSQEELEEDEEEIITKTTREEESSSKQQLQHCPFSSPPSNFSLSSSSPSTTHHHNHNHDVTNVPHQQNQWLGMNHHHHHSPDSHNSAASKGLGLLHQHHHHHHQDATTSNFTNLKQIDFMELSLGNNNNKNKDVVINVPVPQLEQEQEQQPSTHEKEHMFDKVVTPSDVGKLNRLVIPKQHAEKYFPLDSTSNEKGLLLNFEDRNGKLWRFRYSYWNSSQSYVMTKGWSRFVKEKKLDAGDIVSFQRGVGELFRHRLFIDWKRRSNHNHHTIDPSSATLFTPFFLPNQQQYSIRWGGANNRFYSLPYPTPQRLQHQQQNHHDHLQNQMNFNHNMFPFHQYGGGNVNHQYNFHHHDPSSVFYMRSLAPSSMPQGSLSTRQQQQQEGGNASNMIIDSVPVSHYHHHHGNLTSSATTTSTTNGAAKRLRLFGVNMECGGSSTSDDNLANSIPSPSSIVPSLQHLKVPHHEETLSTSTRFEEDKRREEASMIFGLDTSLQYHNYQQQ